MTLESLFPSIAVGTAINMPRDPHSSHEIAQGEGIVICEPKDDPPSDDSVDNTSCLIHDQVSEALGDFPDGGDPPALILAKKHPENIPSKSEEWRRIRKKAGEMIFNPYNVGRDKWEQDEKFKKWQQKNRQKR